MQSSTAADFRSLARRYLACLDQPTLLSACRARSATTDRLASAVEAAVDRYAPVGCLDILFLLGSIRRARTHTRTHAPIIASSARDARSRLVLEAPDSPIQIEPSVEVGGGDDDGVGRDDDLLPPTRNLTTVSDVELSGGAGVAAAMSTAGLPPSPPVAAAGFVPPSVSDAEPKVGGFSPPKTTKHTFSAFGKSIPAETTGTELLRCVCGYVCCL